MIRTFDVPGTRRGAARPLVLVTTAVATTVVALALLLAAHAPPARASDSGPPRTVLVKEGRELQEGLRYWDCWTTDMCNDAMPTPVYPEPVAVREGSRLTLRILKPEKPRSLALGVNGRDLDGYDRLRRVVVGGEVVGWQVPLRVERPHRLYRITLGGHWPHQRTEQGTLNRDARWSFAVETRKPRPGS